MLDHDTREFCKAHCHLGATDLQRMYPLDKGGLSRSGWNHWQSRNREKYPDLPWAKTVMGVNPSRHYDMTAQAVDGIDQDALTKLLQSQPCSLTDLCDRFDVSPKRMNDALARLKAAHLLVTETAAGITLARQLQPTADAYRIDSRQFAETVRAFGVISDPHIGSKYERLDVNEDLFDRFVAEGVTDVLVPGNWIDGSGRRFNEHDIYVHGVTEQVENFLRKWPQRDGINTHVVSGDDHEGWYVQDDHVNIGHVLEDEARRMGRQDIFDLGYMERDITLEQEHGSAILRVIHPGGGSSYATSYTMQKYVESLQGGEKPKIIVAGHYHKYDVSYPREVHTIQAGCTQDQTPFMRKKKLGAHVGGVIMWVRQNELGVVTSLKHEFFPYYDKKFYAYRWQREGE